MTVDVIGETKFRELCRQVLSATDFEDGLREHLGTAHMRTKLLNRPSQATNDQLLLFSELLDTPAYILYRDYGVGCDTVTERELTQHKLVFEKL